MREAAVDDGERREDGLRRIGVRGTIGIDLAATRIIDDALSGKMDSATKKSGDQPTRENLGSICQESYSVTQSRAQAQTKA